MSKLLLFSSAYLNNPISFSLFIGLLEIIKHIIQMEHKKVKNLNGRRRTSWLFDKHCQGFELGTTKNQSS